MITGTLTIQETVINGTVTADETTIAGTLTTGQPIITGTVQAGIIGIAGPAGADGTDGADGTGDLTYKHIQSVASSVWTMTHNLGKYPSLTVITTAGDEIHPSVKHLNINTTEATFSSAYAGTGQLN